MFRLFSFLSLLFLFATTAFSQTLSSLSVRNDTLLQYHTTVGTSAQIALPLVNVGNQLHGWRFCADAGNTNVVYLGQLTDPATDGMVIGAGICFLCENCMNTTLKSMRTKGGAASQGYSVTQFR